MAAFEAARIGDEIGHTSALAGLIVGVIAAAAIAVAVVAIVGTGGMAAVAVGAGIAAAAAGGGLGGAYIGELIPTSPTGAIITGSFNVFIGGAALGAARASIDTAACSGVVLAHATPLIAQGSSNIFINNMMAARRTDKLVCGASISKGCPHVFMGGGTANVPGLEIDSDVPAWLTTTLEVVALVGGIIATGGAILAFGAGPALGGLIGGYLGGKLLGAVGGEVGNKIGGYFGNAELGQRIGEVSGGFVGGLLGGMAGAHAAGGAPPGELPPEGETTAAGGTPEPSSEPTTTPEPTPEPTREPTPNSTPEQVPDAEPTPESNPEPSSEPNPESQPEETPQENDKPEDSRPADERPCEGDPVDVVTGEVCVLATDFEIAGALPLRLTRTYTSGLKETSCFGPKWRSTWGEFIEVDAKGTIWYITADAQKLRFSPRRPEMGGWLRTAAALKVKLRRTPSGYLVENGNRNALRFEECTGTRWLLSSITDPNGHQINLRYDEGALRRVHHSGGYRLVVSGTKTQIRDVSLEQKDGTLQRLIGYRYDDSGRLSGIVNSSGLALTYEYDGAGRLTRWADRVGTWYGYRYDAAGRCIEIAGNAHVFWRRFLYYPEQNKTVVSGSDRGIRTYRYNDRKQVVELTDALGGVTRTKWNKQGQKASETNPMGASVYFHYDSAGNMTSRTDALWRNTEFRRNAAGQVETIVDAAGKRWSRRYDALGNLVETGLEGGGRWRYDRDAHGNMVTLTNPSGAARVFTYDSAGLLASSTDWKLNRTTYFRDELGRLIRKIDPLGRETKYSYFDLDKMAAVHRPDGSVIQWEHNAEGMVTKRIEADGRAYTYSYGPFDKTSSAYQPNGGRLRYAYDTETRLQAVQNERGEVYRYSYDMNGNLIEEIDWTGRRLQYSYDLAGFCIKRTNGRGEETFIDRDALGHMVGKRSSDGSFARFRYDEHGRIVEAGNQWVTAKLERDAYGRVVRETQGEHGVESVYDERGLRIRRTTTNGHRCDWTVNENGRPEALRLDENELLRFDYDAAGRETQRNFGDNLLLRQSFDASDQLTSQWAGFDGEPPAAERHFRYDSNQRLLEINDQRWGASSFAYDENNRIQTAHYAEEHEEFDYDRAGSIVKSALRVGSEAEQAKTVVHFKSTFFSTGGRLQNVADARYWYDEDGRVTEKHEGGQVWKFEWSVEGQLTKIIQSSGQQWRYEYDPFGRRIRKVGGGTSIAYVWDGAVVCEEIRERAGEDAKTTVAWVFEPESFRPLLKREHGKTYFCITDHAGTPCELVTKSGEVAWSARFNVWGKLQAPKESSTDCPVRFQGQWFDEESGLHYNRYRYFEPESRQYLSPDPIGLSGGTRTYGYVHNPLSLVDPLGLAACDNQKFASREDAHNAAKDRAGIPRSQEPSDQWDVGNDQIRRGTGDPNYKYSDDPGAAGHYEQYDTPQGSRVIAEHTSDPNAPDPHFHAGQPKGDPSDPDYDFRNNRYQQVDGKHHYFYTP